VIVELGSLLASILGGTVLFSENLAGVLILFSAAAFGLGWRRAGFAGAVVALFVRELAALYVLVCLFLAWREKRFAEVAAWLLAILAYGVFFLWHAHMVHAQLGPTDFSYPGGWLRFGGASFILATAWANGVFMLFPMWISAIALPFAVLGLLAWPGREAPRFLLTAAGYILAFAFFGKPQNGYWGAVYMPIVTIGLVWAVPATLDLVRAATLRRSVTGSSPEAAQAT
jgi:hypothetical protein